VHHKNSRYLAVDDWIKLLYRIHYFLERLSQLHNIKCQDLKIAVASNRFIQVSDCTVFTISAADSTFLTIPIPDPAHTVAAPITGTRKTYKLCEEGLLRAEDGGCEAI
jgi:hypothetical protein